MKTPAIDDELRLQFEEAAQQAECELVHAEFKGGVLRLVLDREGGIALDDCATVSKQVSTLLDATDFGSGRYTLEVSSPGLDRQLYGPSDYRRFAGSLVRVSWRSAEMESRRTVVARLEGVNEDQRPPAIELVVPDTDERLEIEVEDIQIARLEPQF